MKFTVHHTAISGSAPHWYQYDGAYRNEQNAICRARNLGLNNGGYVCVKNTDGKVIYGTDPADLDRAIRVGINVDFRALA